MAGCCWIAEWCGVADRAKRRALAPNPRSNVVDASSSSSHDGGHGRSASSLLRRSRQPNPRHNDSPYSVATYRSSGHHGSCCQDSSTCYSLLNDAIIGPHPALPKRLQNVLEKRLSFKRPAQSNNIAGRTAMSDNFIYGDITR